MTDKIFKLKILWFYILDAIREWKYEVAHKDLDDLYCCTGFPEGCSCDAYTVREMHEQYLETRR